MPETLEQQLTKHLTDVHSIEVQALQQLLAAPRMARDPELARAFREHIVETEEQERLVRGRLEAHAADPSRLKDVAARAGGVGMVLFARAQPDTPGKLVAHAYSYEHMEFAAYELLSIVAAKAGDRERPRSRVRSATRRRRWRNDSPRALGARSTLPFARSPRTTLGGSSASTWRTLSPSSRRRCSCSSRAGDRGRARPQEGPLRPPRRDALPAGGRSSAYRGAGRAAVPLQESAAARRRSESRRVFWGPAGHASEVGRVRLRF